MLRPRILVAAALLGLTACGEDAAPVSRAAPERPAGTIVYLSSGNRLTAVDVATGRRRTRRISAVATCGPEMHVVAGRIVFAGLRGDRTTVFSIPLALDRRPTRLGAAHQFVPSATPGRVWLAGTDCDRGRMVGVKEVTVDGRVTVASRDRVPGTWVEAAVRSGLVLLRRRALVVWDPRTGRTVRRLRLAAVSETRGDVMAGCSMRCRRPRDRRRGDRPHGRRAAGRGRVDSTPSSRPTGRCWRPTCCATAAGASCSSTRAAGRSRPSPARGPGGSTRSSPGRRAAGCSSAAAATACSPTAQARRERSGYRCGCPSTRPAFAAG